ncbi:MAG: aldehyde dehydrogenase family protein [Bermanella sp.]
MNYSEVKENAIRKTLDNFYKQDASYGSAYLGGKEFRSHDSQAVISPIDGKEVARIGFANDLQMDELVATAVTAHVKWREVPAPRRGELVRLYSLKLRQYKEELAGIISLECGKPWQESLGEVQELIDVCEFAVGLSRQLYGLTISTERKDHRMMEQWHPLGPVFIISAFNFPMAVWGWNAALALVCGDSLIWKPSSQCPLSALACHSLLVNTIKEFGGDQNLVSVMFGEKEQVKNMCARREIKLVSATGSCEMGRAVGALVAARMGRSLLELGGNNALIVCPSCNLELAIRAVTFSALGTSGQRCTTLRRLIVHESLMEETLTRLKNIYKSINIGDPFDEANLMGPVINKHAMDKMQTVINEAQSQGGQLILGGEVLKSGVPENGFYISPAIIKIEASANIVQQETFAPLLYIHSYSQFEEAIEIQNSVGQGLSSAIFTQDISEAEKFMSESGSDCGICNVNIGTSGAEIGGAFGGEKDTGGGRESGSDAWKNYMRRATNTINYSKELPLAQGISFDIPE